MSTSTFTQRNIYEDNVYIFTAKIVKHGIKIILDGK